jgi:hypothetical protein
MVFVTHRKLAPEVATEVVVRLPEAEKSYVSGNHQRVPASLTPCIVAVSPYSARLAIKSAGNLTGNKSLSQ